MEVQTKRIIRALSAPDRAARRTRLFEPGGRQRAGIGSRSPRGLTAKEGTDMVRHILFDIRLPRMLAALTLGGALSVSGFLLQTFFSNPIAGPFVLGISSGAKLVVSVFMVVFLGQGLIMNSWTMILAAFLGAMVSMGFVLTVSKKIPQMSMLVVSGIMIGYICSAATDFIVTFADDSNIVNLHNWSMGSFSGISMDGVKISSLVVTAAFLVPCCSQKPWELTSWEKSTRETWESISDGSGSN